jgi:hypothetical protein
MTAVGSEVERLPWREHRAKYPEHTHGYDIFIQQEDDTNMATRSYVRVTPDMEERVVASYARLGDYAKVAQETNVTERQVRYIVKDRPVLGRSTGSLKQQALLLIRERGPYADIMGLHADLPGPHGLHNLVHILHSLHKAALIDFREASGKNGVTYLNIHARPVSVDALLMSEQSDTQAVTEEEPTVAVAPTNGADGPTYPELARLLSEQKQWLEAQGKAGQYMLAAELLQDTDPETAELLLTKAADIEHVGLSPVEREYLTYAEAHSDDPTG